MLLLVGDIGRTVHLQLVETRGPNDGDKVFCQDNYTTVFADSPIDIYKFPSIASMVDDFVKRAPDKYNKPEKACFAVPAPIIDNTATLTNFKMTIKVADLQKALKISKISLINDFESVCYGILALSKSKSEDLYPLQSSSTNDQSNARMVVIGAGTGLGEAFVAKTTDDIKVYPSEGGHVDFAPRSELEIELLKYLKSELPSDHSKDNQNQDEDEFMVFPHVSVERVVSGSGIVRIYQFLQSKYNNKYRRCGSPDIDRAIATWNNEEKNQTIIDKSVNPAAMIVKAALHDKNKLCEKTMEVFLRAFGAEAGNLALRFLPFNGVYLAGSIVPKILSLIDEDLREPFFNGFKDKFLPSFTDKGRMNELLVEEIPVYVVLNPDVGIIGAAIYAAKL